MPELLNKQQLAMKLFEFSELQDMYAEQTDHELPFFKGQNKVLIALTDHDNISQKKLAEQLGISMQSTAELVSKLQKKNYVTKKKSEKDGRVQLIRLTDRGREEAEKSRSYIPDYLDCINDDEKKQLAKIMDKMNTAIVAKLDTNGIKNIGTRIRMNMLDHKLD